MKEAQNAEGMAASNTPSKPRVPVRFPGFLSRAKTLPRSHFAGTRGHQLGYVKNSIRSAKPVAFSGNTTRPAAESSQSISTRTIQRSRSKKETLQSRFNNASGTRDTRTKENLIQIRISNIANYKPVPQTSSVEASSNDSSAPIIKNIGSDIPATLPQKIAQKSFVTSSLPLTEVEQIRLLTKHKQPSTFSIDDDRMSEISVVSYKVNLFSAEEAETITGETLEMLGSKSYLRVTKPYLNVKQEKEEKSEDDEPASQDDEMFIADDSEISVGFNDLRLEK